MHQASFLPDDYLALKHDRRTNLICLSLFAVVMIAVFGAFLVTNRQWKTVRQAQTLINSSYQEAAEKIDSLTELESQKEQMLNKAELAAALVERVPRSILLAELINRMPNRLSLLEFDMKSDKLKKPPPKAEEAETGRRGGAKAAKTKEEAAQEQKKVEAPRYVVEIGLTGVAPSDLEVSRFMAELNAYPLLRDVTLEYSEEKEVEGQIMRRFNIKMALDPEADVRSVRPLVKPRDLRNPMSDDLAIPVQIGSAAAPGRAAPEGGQ
jgi:Tfp pilus assembly protein PilN